MAYGKNTSILPCCFCIFYPFLFIPVFCAKQMQFASKDIGALKDIILSHCCPRFSEYCFEFVTCMPFWVKLPEVPFANMFEFECLLVLVFLIGICVGGTLVSCLRPVPRPPCVPRCEIQATSFVVHPGELLDQRHASRSLAYRHRTGKFGHSWGSPELGGVGSCGVDSGFKCSWNRTFNASTGYVSGW